MYFSLPVEKHSNKTILFFHFMFEDPLTTKKKNEPKKGKTKERKPLYSFIYVPSYIHIIYIQLLYSTTHPCGELNAITFTKRLTNHIFISIFSADEQKQNKIE